MNSREDVKMTLSETFYYATTERFHQYSAFRPLPLAVKSTSSNMCNQFSMDSNFRIPLRTDGRNSIIHNCYLITNNEKHSPCESSEKNENDMEYTPTEEKAELPSDPLSPEKKNFKCPQCRYLTDRKNNLKRHIITMHQESPRLLECCGVVFKSKSLLREHVSLFHQTGYSCQLCGRNFCRKALLRRHMTVHSGQKDFRCPMCNYATSHKSNLERHQKVHLRNELTQNTQDQIKQIPVVDSNPKYMKFHDLRASLYEGKSALSHRLPSKHYLFSDRLKETYDILKLPGGSSKRSCSPPLTIFADSPLWDVPQTENRYTIVRNHLNNNLSEQQCHDANITQASVSSDDTIHHKLVVTNKIQDRKRTLQRNRIFAQPYKCPNCENVFSSQFQLLSHICKKTQNPNDSYSLITVIQNKIKTREQDLKHPNTSQAKNVMATACQAFPKMSTTATENGYEQTIPTYMLPLKKRIVGNSSDFDKQ